MTFFLIFEKFFMLQQRVKTFLRVKDKKNSLYRIFTGRMESLCGPIRLAGGKLPMHALT